MESSRPNPATRRRPIALARGSFALILVFVAFLGALAGFFCAVAFDPFAVRIKESPFGPDLALRLPKGADFSGLDELADLGKEERERYLEVLRLLAGGESTKASVAADLLASVKSGHPLAAGTAAYLHLRPGPGRKPEISKAAALLEVALAQAGNKDPHPWILYVSALLHESSGRADSALAGYLKAVRLSPQFAYPHAAIGRLQLGRGETGLASAAFRKAIGLMTTSPERYRSGEGTALPLAEPAPFDWLATLYLEVGAADSARMALEYGREKGWRTDRLELVQGWLWEVSGFLPKADSTYRGLLARDSSNPEFARALATLGWKPYRAYGSVATPAKDRAARSAAKAEDAAAVVAFLDPLARQYPGNAPLWMALGQAYYQRGLPGRA
ncbi:MAG TPA: hypothetical protein VK465_17215, partial [Fibrobacteria bacterium]|nr:hypothetical protein [Fibrobacteria bacterium]